MSRASEIEAMWTTDLPTEDGFYLCRQNRSRLWTLLVEKDDEGEMCVQSDGSPVRVWGGEWIGPIDAVCAF